MLFVKFLLIEGCPVVAVFRRNKVYPFFFCGKERMRRALARLILMYAEEMFRRAEALRAGG
ncbi:MAG: hypothetical protein LM576_07850 [Thermofilum sp.]|nr:hypothetical protein [Thermofilum sp.]